MVASAESVIEQCVPTNVWARLRSDSAAQVVDVRTQPEWAFVGVPDLSELGRETILVEWQRYPDMDLNPHFADQVLEALGGEPPQTLFFICRSGVRSMAAARAMASRFAAEGRSVNCINVAEGFEGDLDENRHRGRRGGWKARGLSWRQS